MCYLYPSFPAVGHRELFRCIGKGETTKRRREAERRGREENRSGQELG